MSDLSLYHADNHVVVSEVIESHKRQRATMVGYPGIGWTVRRHVCNGYVTRITVEYSNGVRITELPSEVTLLGGFLDIPEPPNGWGTSVVPLPAPGAGARR